jgi:hypothetical protein
MVWEMTSSSATSGVLRMVAPPYLDERQEQIIGCMLMVVKDPT